MENTFDLNIIHKKNQVPTPNTTDFMIIQNSRKSNDYSDIT